MRKWRRGELIPVDKLMRLLAKNNLARLLWVSSKELKSNLFPTEINDWSIAQLAFVNWCLMYDSVYSSIDRPPERIIKDDELLDKWMEYQNEQFNIRYEENYRKLGFGHKGISAYQADEIYEVEDEFM